MIEEILRSQGCLEMLEKWTQDQALILLTVGLTVIFVEVGAVLSTFLVCSRSNKRTKSQASTFTSTQTLSPFSESDHDFGEESTLPTFPATFPSSAILFLQISMHYS